jgi:quercetin dioxygenase-like cupin family protein/iron-sulfur cluster repair protein YtfE (RIC family)
MKRHPALIPLSHDHHHGLVELRRLRRAAEREAAERRDAAAAFLGFFGRDTRRHFRDEEEQLFPLLVDVDDPASELLTRALLEHQRIHALVSELEAELAAGEVSSASMRHLADALEQHIRFEERTLFPYIEELAGEADLRRLEAAADTPTPAKIPSPEGTGLLWGTETEDLNATLLAWSPGGGPEEHVNRERDVLLVVLAGSATVTVDGQPQLVEAGQAIAIEKGSARRIAAGSLGVRYLSIHTRRPPLQISRSPAA